MEVEPVAMTLQFTRLVADENVPREIIDLLKDMGFKEVYWILEKRPGISDGGASDESASHCACVTR